MALKGMNLKYGFLGKWVRQKRHIYTTMVDFLGKLDLSKNRKERSAIELCKRSGRVMHIMLGYLLIFFR